ncbi:hypothetical protein E2C01_015996 [Portunus trituberculatus]|uniref:Sushi domain-containing protein n=1 Tax=Portunus trituberculatus TaxID=210409 RepID=A0A5B7DPK2_PORTR|nr:hypothetical protein [Portunus trituberculatus]
MLYFPSSNNAIIYLAYKAKQRQLSHNTQRPQTTAPYPHSRQHWAVCNTTAEEGGEGAGGGSGGGGGEGEQCGRPGEAMGVSWVCKELAWGRMCRPSCLPGFVMTTAPPSPLYICGRHTGLWYPSAHLPSCTLSLSDVSSSNIEAKT